jgi:hypothetical protein
MESRLENDPGMWGGVRGEMSAESSRASDVRQVKFRLLQMGIERRASPPLLTLIPSVSS